MEKHYSLFPALTRALFWSFLFYFIFPSSVWGQDDRDKCNHTIVTNDNTIGVDEKALREKMKADGISTELIDKMIAQRRSLNHSGSRAEQDKAARVAFLSTLKTSGQNPAPFAACSDLGVENGWGAWQGTPGRYADQAAPTPSIMTWGVPWATGAPIAPRFNLTSGAGIDPCTPGGGGPPITVVAPGFGNTSILLGEPEITGYYGLCSSANYGTPGGCSEKLNFPLTVTAQDTNFVFAYALVMQNPAHVAEDRPFTGLCVYDSNGNPIPCGCFSYVATSNTPGFYTGNCVPNVSTGIAPLYLPWTIVGINLNPYVGQILNVEITNSDCSQQGHFAHSYWDFKCATLTNTTPTPVCLGQSTTLIAPTDPLITYSYQWSNGANASSIVVTPLQTDTFTVQVISPSGCGFYIPYIVQVTTVTAVTSSTPGICGGLGTATANPSGGTPAYNYSWSSSPIQTTPTATGLTAGIYTVTITDANGCTTTDTVTVVTTPAVTAVTSSTPGICGGLGTATVNPSGGTPTYTYSWSSIPIQTTPTATGLVAGNYTVILTDANGCADTATVTVVTTPAVTAVTSATPGICGGLGTATATPSGGTPAYTYSWSSSPIQTTPTATGLVAGNYIVTVTDANGCTVTLTQPVIVGPGLPTAAFASTAACLGIATTLIDGSVAVSGDPLASWSWSMPSGTPAAALSQNTSTLYNASGTYTVTLIVTSVAGCVDTIVQQVLVYNNPIANFSDTASGCAPLCNQFWDSSNAVSGSIISWQWSFPGGTPSTSTVQNPYICYNTPGTYGVTLTVTNTFGCKNTLLLTPMITVYPYPQAEFCVTPLQASGNNPVFTFCDLWTPNPGVLGWYWNFGDGSPFDSINTDPVHSYSASVTNNDFYTFNICLYVQTGNGCWDSICHPVEILPEFTFYIPNTFTPNGDFTNEFFFGKGRGIKEYDIWLFDRWGNLIWSCHYEGPNTVWDIPLMDGMSAACQWDGKVEDGRSNDLAQEDVYVWKVRLTDVFDQEHKYIGHVNVVK